MDEMSSVGTSFVEATEEEIVSLRVDDLERMNTDTANAVRRTVEEHVTLQGDESEERILEIFRQRFMRHAVLFWVYHQFSEHPSQLVELEDDIVWQNFQSDGYLPHPELPPVTTGDSTDTTKKRRRTTQGQEGKEEERESSDGDETDLDTSDEPVRFPTAVNCKHSSSVPQSVFLNEH